MNRRWSLATIPALALGVALANTGTADAAARPTKIKSFVETDRIRLTGIGRDAGWSYRDDFTHSATLSPLATEVVGRWSNTYKSQGGTWHSIIVAGTPYWSVNGQPWKAYPQLTPQQLASLRAHTDPMHIPPLMFKLKVARHVGKGHWRAAGTLSQLAPLIDNELNLGTADFKRHGYKRLTIDLWLDAKGRPTKITCTGTVPNWERASLTETFTGYDKPLNIVAPKV